MEIIVNGNTEKIPEKLSIQELLQLKKKAPDQVVIELNKNIVKKDDWYKTILGNNDQLEIIKIVGGG